MLPRLCLKSLPNVLLPAEDSALCFLPDDFQHYLTRRFAFPRNIKLMLWPSPCALSAQFFGEFVGVHRVLMRLFAELVSS